MIIKYYIPSIRKCLNLLKKIQADPMTQAGTCYELQEKLISQLTILESKIRAHKKRSKEIKKLFGDRSRQKSKEESKTLKLKLKTIEENIEDYHFLRILFKSIGDGIAFLYIDRFSLKPQNFKESPGFISLKKGNRFERKCFRMVFNKGGIAILNDLTNVLKYFDLTLIKDINVWFPIELKSGKSRRDAQIEKGTRLLKYLIEDQPADVYERGHEMHRVEHLSELRDNVEKVNHLIDRARVSGYVIEKLDAGLTIIISFHNEIEDIEKILTAQGFVRPYLFIQNSSLINQYGYFPFCLSIKSTQDFLDLLADRLTIIQVFDFDYLEKLSANNGYSFEFLGEEFEFIKFMSLTVEGKGIAMSWHYFGRMFFEYLSSEWFFSEQFKFLEKLEELYPKDLMT
jgi:hypothetical protein